MSLCSQSSQSNFPFCFGGPQPSRTPLQAVKLGPRELKPGQKLQLPIQTSIAVRLQVTTYNPTSRKQQLLLREYLGTFREQEYQQVTGRLAAMLYGATFMVRAPAKLFKEVSEIVLSASLVVYGVGRGQMESRRFPQGCLKTSCCCQRS